MSLARFLESVSDDAPCGPDLEAADDGVFIDYYFGAIDRLPERFVDQVTGEMFDRRTLRVDEETRAIEALLDRSRDLRLLAIGAQFLCLAGRIAPLAEYVDTMAGLLEAHWPHVHPRVENGPVERCNTLELLDVPATMVMPLEYAALAQDRRAGTITLRAHALATGQRTLRAGERAGDASAIMTALRSAENAAAVEASYAAICRLRDALRRIELCCKTAEGGAFAPNFARITPVVAQVEALLAEARPDLAGEAADASEAPPGADGDATDEIPAAPGPAATLPAGAVASHAAARAALAAVEGYFAAMEPSSPALMLVRQAQELIGRPLVQALELLMPDLAAKARITFGTEGGFLLSMERMRALSRPSEDEGAAGDKPAFTVTTREQAAALMAAVEAFYRQTEPSSPIPTLLFKAKTYQGRDFTAILADLFPAQK
jgi:type VI secretion system protein ImpA